MQNHEYLNPKMETPNNIMFSNLHHPRPQTHPSFPNPTRTHSQISEDDNTSLTTTTTAQKRHISLGATDRGNSNDGATIEAIRRPRGRPPGSKNKPKPTVFVAQQPEPVMSPFVIEVSPGNDLIESIDRFCCSKKMGLCVLTGSGTVADVTLRQPSATAGATVTFHGRFDILSLNATFFPHSISYPVPNGFTISLAGPRGQIVGGLVAGSLMAAGTVYLVAASFNNPTYHRLPADNEVRNEGSGGGGESQSPPVSGGSDGGSQAVGESCGMPMYFCHVPSDVIWAPTARQPPPPRF